VSAGARDRLILIVLLVLIGAAWGITQPFAKIAVSEGYRHFGIIFWQFALGAALLAAMNRVRGRGLPFARRHLVLYAIIALIGTLLPNSASYTAAIHLPSGILSIVLSLVPMMSFPIALALGMDRFSALRFTGLALGFAAILMIALPETSLPDPAMVWWLPMALVAPAFYADRGQLRRPLTGPGTGPGAGPARRVARRRGHGRAARPR
jgi:drug/metabolite transporter (DMT)-like permease